MQRPEGWCGNRHEIFFTLAVQASYTYTYLLFPLTSLVRLAFFVWLRGGSWFRVSIGPLAISRRERAHHSHAAHENGQASIPTSYTNISCQSLTKPPNIVKKGRHKSESHKFSSLKLPNLFQPMKRRSGFWWGRRILIIMFTLVVDDDLLMP